MSNVPVSPDLKQLIYGCIQSIDTLEGGFGRVVKRLENQGLANKGVQRSVQSTQTCTENQNG